MAEQMAEVIKETILSGEVEAGAILPTEPELAEQFEVSRAVVRDATRILMALGLVEVQHGRGVFVTEANNEAFGQALLLALRRAGAKAWDVEQFEQLIFPEVAALAAASATDDELLQIQQLADSYFGIINEYYERWWGQEAPAKETLGLIGAYHALIHSIFRATHNHVLIQLAQPLLKLRNLRTWAQSEDQTPQSAAAMESAYFKYLLEGILSRDPDAARQIAAKLMQLPPEAIEAMKQTPVGEITKIPISPPKRVDIL